MNPNFGKVPKYLEKYNKAAEVKQEEVKRRQEEALRCPPGTKLMPEEDRLKTLTDLKENKKTVTEMLNKMPISMKTQAMQRTQKELED
eukprot:CAMPEP_0170502144 /NCGR_PEP_ID=MMETSP0208-20121228/40587_1 /TAXON_ID=197538 /ORGANISM="Strombidium inclinatum, Strain S3" /LENGTH=87 /DNA_ID=CAMNT_0010781045 /DNA_START=794 /DNA_END=1054 /DNA_ORIENTATION=+